MRKPLTTEHWILVLGVMLAISVLGKMFYNQTPPTCNLQSLKTQLEFTGTVTIEFRLDDWLAEYVSKPETGRKDRVTTRGRSACEALDRVNSRLAEIS